MTNKQFLLSTHGTFHYFDLANELNSRSMLNRIISGYPKFKLKKYKLPITRTGRKRSPKDILSSGEYKIIDLLEIWPELHEIPKNLHPQLETDCRYNIYLKRQKEDIKAYKKENKTKIPTNFDYNKVKGLSNESLDLLTTLRPATISQASRLPGFTPTATLLLLRHLKRDSKQKVKNEH